MRGIVLMATRGHVCVREREVFTLLAPPTASIASALDPSPILIHTYTNTRQLHKHAPQKCETWILAQTDRQEASAFLSVCACVVNIYVYIYMNIYIYMYIYI